MLVRFLGILWVIRLGSVRLNSVRLWVCIFGRVEFDNINDSCANHIDSWI